MHLGQLIKRELDGQGRSASWLANELSCTPHRVSQILAKESLDTGLLMHISDVLGVDFFQFYSEELKRMLASSLVDP